MTQEDKELLLKDLCARLPYGVKGIKVYDKDKIVELDGILPICKPNPNFGQNSEPFIELQFSDLDCSPIDKFKPYLRPMSSMTEDEEDELYSVRMGNYGEDVDWLNTHHFDFRNLIEKGLAIEAPTDMYIF